MKKYKAGLVVGRFQPFHKGHKYLIETALTYVDELVIGIGSADVDDSDNPYDVKKRLSFVKKFVEEEGMGSRVTAIVPLDNHPDDTVWLQWLLEKTGPIDVVIGNNEWVNGIFEKVGIPAIRISYLKRHIYEGVKIRELMQKDKKWEDRVPSYLESLIKS